MTSLFKVCAFATTAVLSACSLVGGQHEALVQYGLTRVAAAPSEASNRSAFHPWQLVVAEPQAINPLNTARIVVLPEAGVIEFYKGVRWRDTAPVLIQALIVQALQDSTNLQGIGTPADMRHADFTLQIDLQEFQSEYRGAKVPTVSIRFAAQLVDDNSGGVLANRIFATEQACASTDVQAVTIAFQKAVDRIAQQIVAWTVETGDTKWGEYARTPTK